MAGRPKRRAKGGYSPEVAKRICDAIAEGESLATIAKMPGMPARRTVRDWLSQHPDFERQYEIARRERTDNLVDEAIAIADAVDGSDNAAVQKARLQVDTRRWLASKLLPERFGDKLVQEISGPNGRALIPAQAEPSKVALALLNVLSAIPGANTPSLGLSPAMEARAALPAMPMTLLTASAEPEPVPVDAEPEIDAEAAAAIEQQRERQRLRDEHLTRTFGFDAAGRPARPIFDTVSGRVVRIHSPNRDEEAL